MDNLPLVATEAGSVVELAAGLAEPVAAVVPFVGLAAGSVDRVVAVAD